MSRDSHQESWELSVSVKAWTFWLSHEQRGPSSEKGSEACPITRHSPGLFMEAQTTNADFRKTGSAKENKSSFHFPPQSLGM